MGGPVLCRFKLKEGLFNSPQPAAGSFIFQSEKIARMWKVLDWQIDHLSAPGQE